MGDRPVGSCPRSMHTSYFPSPWAFTSMDTHIHWLPKTWAHSVIDWARQAQEMGAGEIFLNCIDRDGFRQGYDLVLLKTLVDAVNIPVIAMGGVLTWQHLADGIIQGGAEAGAAANIFQYTAPTTRNYKQHL